MILGHSVGFKFWVIGFLLHGALCFPDTTTEPNYTSPPLGNISDVRYFLWTRSNPSDEDYYSLDPLDLSELSYSPFAADLPTFFMYHGYGSHPPLVKWITDTKDELLQIMPANVFSVDWSMLVPDHHYQEALQNVYQVGDLTATLIDELHYLTGHSPSQIHIIGHSLGAHAAGMSGKYVTTGNIARVTGLDPAGPGFYEAPSASRLDASDADFVDIIHTNSGSMLEGCYGLFKAIGDVDFYPNGGRHQPGCVPHQPGGDIIDLIGSFAFLFVFSYLQQAGDVLLAMIGSLSMIIGILLKGLAASGWMLYLGATITLIPEVPLIAAYSAVSKLVSHSEYGAIFGEMCALETLMPLISYELYSHLYIKTAQDSPSAIYVFTAVLTSFTALTFLFIKRLERIRPGYQPL